MNLVTHRTWVNALFLVCMGLGFAWGTAGPASASTKVDVEKPPITDDPTATDPFDLNDDELTVERAAYASPFR